MPKVRVIHWREEEAGPLREACRKAGMEVDDPAGGGTALTRAIRDRPPDIVVIDLSRLPSHGREIAVWLRTCKATRAIPIVFAGGAPDKVSAIRDLLPDAEFCDAGGIGAVLKRVAKSAPRQEPVIPPGMMERAAAKPAAQKLGITAASTICVVDPPRGFPRLLGVLPEAVVFQEEAAPVTLWFVEDRGELMLSLRRMRAAAARTRLWLLWRKGSTDSVSQNLLRDLAREVGLVDYRICSVDRHWSAMLFAVKKA